MPIIAFSVKDTPDEKVLVLDLGADDYIAEPFEMEEVLARVRVALRHMAHVQTGTATTYAARPTPRRFSATQGMG